MHPGAVFTISEKLWRWPGEAAWYFVRLDKETSEEIASTAVKRGWGSVKVSVAIDELEWKTSLFPEKEGTYLLPVKAAIRKQKNLQEGDCPRLTITLVT